MVGRLQARTDRRPGGLSVTPEISPLARCSSASGWVEAWTGGVVMSPGSHLFGGQAVSSTSVRKGDSLLFFLCFPCIAPIPVLTACFCGSLCFGKLLLQDEEQELLTCISLFWLLFYSGSLNSLKSKSFEGEVPEGPYPLPWHCPEWAGPPGGLPDVSGTRSLCH